MEQLLKDIILHYSDPEINRILKSCTDNKCSYTSHFNQGEEFFLQLDKTFTVPSFPIHHDFRKSEPTKQYKKSMQAFVKEIAGIIPDIFIGLRYFFDPSEVLRPCFFHVYKIGQATYLYLLRLDLQFRPNQHKVITKGKNDVTASYQTNQLFMEVDIIPIQHVEVENNKVKSFTIKQSISQTWIGETGRGYFVQGIWLDHEITQFFSKLFTPKGKMLYPYFPLNCKYRAICHQIVDPSPAGRKRTIPFLHKAVDFLEPHINSIQNALKKQSFSESLDQYREIKQTVPPEFTRYFSEIDLELYLNDQDMKEWQLEFNYPTE